MIAQECQPSLDTDVLRSTEELKSILPEWKKLYQTSRTQNPFNHPAWTIRWSESPFLRDTNSITQDQLAIMVHSDTSGNIQGIVPLVETKRNIGPVAIKKIRSVGFAPGAKPVEMPPLLIAPGWEEATTVATFKTLFRMKDQYDWAELRGVYRNSYFSSQLENPDNFPWKFPGKWTLSEPYYVLNLPPTWNELRSGLKGSTKRKLNQGYNRLKELTDTAGQNWSVEFVDHPEQIQVALNEFFDLHKNRANFDSPDSKHQDHFHSKELKQYVRNVAEDLVLDKNIQVARLKIDDQTVASRVLLPTPDQLFLYYSGFDTDWSRYGVMMTLTAETIRMAIEAKDEDEQKRFMAVNLSSGQDRGKTVWVTDHEQATAPHIGTFHFASPTIRARAIDSVSQLVSNVVNMSKKPEKVTR